MLSRESHDRAADWAEFFRGLSGNSFVLTLVELALGVHYCVANASLPLVRITAFVYAGIASLLSLVALGGGEKLWSDAFYSHGLVITFTPGQAPVTNFPTFDGFRRESRPWVVLYGVEELMLFVAALAILVLAIGVAVTARKKESKEAPRQVCRAHVSPPSPSTLRGRLLTRQTPLQAIGLLLAAASLNLAMWAWAMGDAGWRFAGRFTPSWWFAASGLVENWTILINLFLVLVAGTRKRHGLWSSSQPWMS